jgi:hypothetical protein
MTAATRWTITSHDRDTLRRLAARQAEIAQEPVMAERRRLWIAHAGLRGERPMILAENQGVTNEILPRSALTCEQPWAQELEFALRMRIWHHEHVDDDMVVEPWLDVKWQVDLGDYGVVVEKRHGDNQQRLGSYVWDPPIRDLDADLNKLHPRRPTVDREGTLAWVDHLERLLGDLLPVRIRGSYYWTMGLTWPCIDLIGLQGLMMAMVDQPEGLHRLMAFLRNDHLAVVDWLEAEGLYTLNNENDYVGSGTVGYTAELPSDQWRPGDPVRPRDLWVLSESQETVGVSPAMFEEFVFRYQLPIIQRFGLCYYGCCEPLHARWSILQRIPNLRRVSISPWCDQAFMAEALGDRYLFCRKPSPALISGAVWDEEAIRQDLAHTMAVTGGRHLEVAMKDVHTLADQPERLGRWVQIAREETAR